MVGYSVVLELAAGRLWLDFAMIIIVECRHKLACPGLQWLAFSDEPNRFVSKSEPIQGIGTRYRAGPSR